MARFWRGTAPVRERTLTPPERAYALLREHLDGDQLTQLESLSFWKVRGSQGGVYRIGFRTVEPVLWVRSDQTRRAQRASLARAYSFCVVSTRWVPMADELLAFMLLIMSNEKAFQRIAVRHEVGADTARRWFEDTRLRSYS